MREHTRMDILLIALSGGLVGWVERNETHPAIEQPGSRANPYLFFGFDPRSASTRSKPEPLSWRTDWPLSVTLRSRTMPW